MKPLSGNAVTLALTRSGFAHLQVLNLPCVPTALRFMRRFDSRRTCTSSVGSYATKTVQRLVSFFVRISDRLAQLMHEGVTCTAAEDLGIVLRCLCMRRTLLLAMWPSCYTRRHLESQWPLVSWTGLMIAGSGTSSPIGSRVPRPFDTARCTSHLPRWLLTVRVSPPPSPPLDIWTSECAQVDQLHAQSGQHACAVIFAGLGSCSGVPSLQCGLHIVSSQPSICVCCCWKGSCGRALQTILHSFDSESIRVNALRCVRVVWVYCVPQSRGRRGSTGGGAEEWRRQRGVPSSQASPKGTLPPPQSAPTPSFDSPPECSQGSHPCTQHSLVQTRSDGRTLVQWDQHSMQHLGALCHECNAMTHT